jgi:hypothetical protein
MNWYKMSKIKISMDWQVFFKNIGIPLSIATSLFIYSNQNNINQNDLYKKLKEPKNISVLKNNNINNKQKREILISNISNNEEKQKNNDENVKNIDNGISFEEASNFIKSLEIKKNKVFINENGKESIGIGYLLNIKDNPKAKETIEQLGLNYDNVIKGNSVLTEDQVEKLFRISLKNAIMQMSALHGNYISKYPKKIQLILTYLAYSSDKYEEFRPSIRLMWNKNYKGARQKLKETKWYKESGTKGDKIVNMLYDIN